MKTQTLQSEVEHARKVREDALEALKAAEQNYWEAQTQNREPVVQAYTAWRKECFLLAYRQASDVYYRLRDELFKVENA